MSDEIKDPLLLQEDGEYSAGVETTPAEAVPPAAEGGEKFAGSGEDIGIDGRSLLLFQGHGFRLIARCPKCAYANKMGKLSITFAV